MSANETSALDRLLARVCVNCPVCRPARARQAGAAFWLVRKVEGNVCPFCRAYARVYGAKPHEPPADAAARRRSA